MTGSSSGLNYILAQAPIAAPVPGLDKSSGIVATQLIFIFGAALIILAIFIIWAKYFRNRKPRKRLEHKEKVYRQSKSSSSSSNSDADHDDDDEPSEGDKTRKRYKYRSRRREHRRRNPTLAETGGLSSGPSDDPVKQS